jgi:hypothetical protein
MQFVGRMSLKLMTLQLVIAAYLMAALAYFIRALMHIITIVMKV